MPDESPTPTQAAERTGRWPRHRRDLAKAAALLALGFLLGFRLPLIQVWLASGSGLVDFHGPFEAGHDRVGSVPGTVILWFCAITVPLAAGLAARLNGGVTVRLLAAGAAVAGTWLARPTIVGATGNPAQPDAVQEITRSDVASDLVAGLVVGAVVAVLVAVRPVFGGGIAWHAAVIWLFAVLPAEGRLFAGVPEPDIQGLANEPGEYLLAYGVLAGLLAALFIVPPPLLVRRGEPVPNAALVALTGPALGFVPYMLSDPHLNDSDAGAVAFIVLFLGLALAPLSAAVTGRRARRRRAAE